MEGQACKQWRMGRYLEKLFEKYLFVCSGAEIKYFILKLCTCSHTTNTVEYD